MSGNIQLHVFVSPYKPIVSVLPSWDAAQQATWPASSVSLLTGEREAVLIDALATQTEAERVVDWVRAMGKDLKTVYITHAHGDHFFGLNTILTAFPAAKAVALPEVVPLAREQAERILTEAREQAQGALAARSEDAARLQLEAQERANEIRANARAEAREILSEAHASAAEVLREGTTVTRNLRDLSVSLRNNAERLLRDVRLTHGSMTARLDQADAGGTRERPRGARGEGSRSEASRGGMHHEEDRGEGGDLDVPEFMPRG